MLETPPGNPPFSPLFTPSTHGKIALGKLAEKPLSFNRLDPQISAGNRTLAPAPIVELEAKALRRYTDGNRTPEHSSESRK